MKNIFGTEIGEYFLLEQLGEGGMAKVYNALDLRLDRNVAIKVILPSKRSSQLFLQQFEQEAKALANLTHTNIVKVLDYGFDEQQPYLVMDFIKGGTLKQAFREPLPWQKAAEILAPIAKALDYVHRQKIIHRDIKPSNILLDEDYRPMLSDFGVVKLMEVKEENNTPAISVGVGTPDYMSPEQALGRDVDFRADIYSLGVVFYELITGQKPFTADTPMAIVIKHTTDEFPRPRYMNKNIPKFVEDAILRAVQKKPEKRYRDMGQFADVLEMIALGDNAPRRKINAIIQPQQHKINPLMLGVAMLMLLGTIIMGISGIFPVNISSKAISTTAFTPIDYSDNCESNECSTENSPGILFLPTPSPSVTAKSISNTEIENIITATAEPTNLTNINTSSVTLLGEPLPQQLPSESHEIARWGIGGVNKVAWSPDGKTLAMGTTSGIFLYDAENWNKTLFINPDFQVVELVYTQDSQKIVAGSNTGKVNIWDAKTGQSIHQYQGENSSVTGITFSPNGKNIVIGYLNGGIRYFDIDSNSASMVVSQYPSVHAVGISADGRFLYASNGEANIFTWDISQKKIVSELSHLTPIRKFKLSSDRLLMLSSGTANIVYLWDLSSGRIINSFSNLGAVPTDFDFSNDDNLIVVSLSNGDIKLFKTPDIQDYSVTQTAIFTVKGYQEQILTIAFSPQETMYATGNWQEGLKIWDIESENAVFALNQSMQSINQLYFSSDALWLASGHDDNVVRIWNLSDAQDKYQMVGYLTKGMPFSPDNRYLVVVRQSEKRFDPDILQIIELSNGNLIAELPGYIPNAFIRFTQDSKLLVMGTPTKAIIWDVATWEKVSIHGGINAGCGQFFTPQSDRLAVISDAGIFFTYDEDMAVICGTKPKGATLVYYFHQQRRALFVLGNGQILNWRFQHEELQRINLRDTYPLPDEIFLGAHQESRLYATRENNSLKIYRNDKNLVTSIAGQNDYEYRAAFLPNAHKLFALGSKYGSIHIWTLP